VSETTPGPSTENETTEGARALLDGAAPSLKNELIRSGSVDLTRYKTEELKQRFDELFGFRTLLPWALGGLGTSLLGFSLLWWFLFAHHVFLVAAGTFTYMLLQGIVIGLLAAAILIVARVLQQAVAIVDLTLKTVRQVLNDLKRMGANDYVRSELTSGLIHAVILPTLQKIITLKLGFLRLPISFVINRVLKRMGRRLTRALERDEKKLLQTDDPPDEGDRFDELHRRIEIIARRTRIATLVPSALLLWLLTVVSSVPWLLLWLIGVLS
jgi:hypothetical protein